MIRESNLTFDEFLQAIRPDKFDIVYTDENCQLPTCIHDDFNEWLIGRTQHESDSKTYILKRTYREYYNKVMNGKGISYNISFFNSHSKGTNIGMPETIDGVMSESMLSVFLKS